DAARSFLHSIKLSPDNPEFRQRISELYAQNGMWVESVPHLRHLVNLVPDRPDFKAFLRQAESFIK
ncbi:MAG: tetratricopeptide repeat protein, partial [Opitutales bacterium]